MIKYPYLRLILTPESVSALSDPGFVDDADRVDVTCQKCHSTFNISLISLLKQTRRNVRNREYFLYNCHLCSKAGKTRLGVKDLDGVIDWLETAKKFPESSKNVKRRMVVAKCEDCHTAFDVKLSSILHQARRHRMSSRTCVYKCFDCGVKRPDALAKSRESRAKQLSDGFKSGLEVAMENRLNHLGIKFENQFRVDMYFWDFYLPDHDLLVDINGEYWHSLPENVARDKSKLTYTQKYHPQYKILSIEEKNFLNPNIVDKIILSNIGPIPDPIIITDFEFGDLRVERIGGGKGSSREPYVEFLNSYHYSMCGRPGKVVYGAFLGNTLVAVCKFNRVTRKEIASSIGLKCTQVLELDRFCIHPNYQKRNLASWFISRCVKLVFGDFSEVMKLVSFADSTFGHHGTIYKASNWTKLGETRPSYHYIDTSGLVINKKRVFDIASKLLMTEGDYVKKHNLEKYKEMPKTKYSIDRDFVLR